MATNLKMGTETQLAGSGIWTSNRESPTAGRGSPLRFQKDKINNNHHFGAVLGTPLKPHPSAGTATAQTSGLGSLRTTRFWINEGRLSIDHMSPTLSHPKSYRGRTWEQAAKTLNQEWHHYNILCISKLVVMDEENQEPTHGDNAQECHAYSLLERAVRLLRKNITFEFYDDIRKMVIEVGPPTTQQPCLSKNEHALKVFWRCLCSRFFKPLEDCDVEVLKYLRVLVECPIKGLNVRYFKSNSEPQYPYFNQDSYSALERTLKKPQSHTNLDLFNYENVLYHIYLENLALATSTTDKKEVARIKRLRKDKCSIIPKMKNREEQAQIAELERENLQLKGLFEECNHHSYLDDEDELSTELRELEIYLQELNCSNKRLVEDVVSKANDEIRLRECIYIVNSEEQGKYINTHKSQILRGWEEFKENSLDRVEVLKKYLEKTVLGLEERQVAESIARLEPKNKGYEVVFEKGSGLIQSVYSMKEILRFERLREFSLVKFYNTSMKTRFYSMCHLNSGFQLLFKKKSIESLRHKSLLEEKSLGLVAEDTKKSFESFDICHHCKQLYDTLYLTKCNYHSSTMGPPTHNLSFMDPYIQFIVQQQTPSTAREFHNNQKNPFMYYHKKGSEFVCHRRYCRFCLKQNYDSIDKNGLCPFCQGVCYCSRCLRNDNVAKLKTIFSLMGGDVVSLSKKSIYHLLTPSLSGEEVTSKAVNKRTKKKCVRVVEEIPQNFKVTWRGYTRLLQLRQQMEECRQICQLVKRRQKQKLFLRENEEKIFQDVAGDMQLDFKVQKRTKSSDNGSTEVQVNKGRKTRRQK